MDNTDTIQTIILCGGLGTRLREETEYRPKPMVPIGGRPILWHIMKIYAHYGHTDFILPTGYKGEMIKEYFCHYHQMTRDICINIGKNAVTYLKDDDAIENWKITNQSYENLLTDWKDVFTYLDPPYDIKDNLYGKKGNMHNKFNHDSFATICDRFVGPQLISYNSSQLVKDRFEGWQTGEFDLTYTMRSVGEYMREQKERKELLLFNYGIEGLA